MPMNATAGGAMLAGVAEAEPDRNWFGRGGCVEQHDDGTMAVFVRGELLGTYSAADVATRDVFIAVVLEQATREDRSGTEFERLSFAYLVRAFEWKTIDWYGQLGGDSGRDIWGVREAGATECFQCANHRALKFKKAEEDLAKLIAGSNGLPTKFTLITGGKVTAEMREKVVARAMESGRVTHHGSRQSRHGD